MNVAGVRLIACATKQKILIFDEQNKEHEFEQQACDEICDNAVVARVANPIEQVFSAVAMIEPSQTVQLLLQNSRIVRKYYGYIWLLSNIYTTV